MWNPDNEAPQQFLDLLNEEYLDSDDDVIEEVEDEGNDLTTELESLNLAPGSELFLVQRDGSLAPVTIPDNESRIEASDSEDDDHAALLQSISPITPPFNSPLPELSDEEAMQESSSSGSGRGSYRVGRRGRGGIGRRGRGRGHFVSRNERRRLRERNAWSRGQPLVERYLSDEELSTQVREEIERVTGQREGRERARHARRAGNVELEEDVNDAESEFYESQEFVWTSMDGWSGAPYVHLNVP